MPKACGDPESVFGLLLRSAHRNDNKECLCSIKNPLLASKKLLKEWIWCL